MVGWLVGCSGGRSAVEVKQWTQKRNTIKFINGRYVRMYITGRERARERERAAIILLQASCEYSRVVVDGL